MERAIAIVLNNAIAFAPFSFFLSQNHRVIVPAFDLAGVLLSNSIHNHRASQGSAFGLRLSVQCN